MASCQKSVFSFVLVGLFGLALAAKGQAGLSGECVESLHGENFVALNEVIASHWSRQNRQSYTLKQNLRYLNLMCLSEQNNFSSLYRRFNFDIY